MITAISKNLCEEVEFSIYSDAELTKEQKNHIENCDNCKALLSQISSLKNVLGQVSVSGIEEGQIADAVMQKIAKDTTITSFPKFKITHHLGTAAAVVIVLVAALMIKNPSPKLSDGMVSENASVSGSAIQQDAYGELPIQYMHGVNNESANQPSVDAEAVGEVKLLLKAAPSPDTDNNFDGTDEIHDTIDTVSDTLRENEPQAQKYYLNEACSDYKESIIESYDEAVPESAEEEDLYEGLPKEAPILYTDSDFESKNVSQSSNGSCAKFNPFRDIEFSDNLKDNIELANSILSELYTGKEAVFKIEQFSIDSFASNEEFLKAIENFNLYDFYE